MSDAMIDRISAHVEGKGIPIAFSPVSEEVVRDAETILRFGIPELLRSLYLTIADGGFGGAQPSYGLGYGILGIVRDDQSDPLSLVECYKGVQEGAHFIALQENKPTLEWKAGVLPFCAWGCNILSCVDCNDPAYRVVQSDHCEVTAQDYTLVDFFDMWVAGVSILDGGHGDRASVQGINPFTKQPMLFFGARKKRK
jgi:hypothetical protein